MLGSLTAAQWVGVAASTAGVYATILALPVLTLPRGSRRTVGVPAGAEPA